MRIHDVTPRRRGSLAKLHSVYVYETNEEAALQAKGWRQKRYDATALPRYLLAEGLRVRLFVVIVKHPKEDRSA